MADRCDFCGNRTGDGVTPHADDCPAAPAELRDLVDIFEETIQEKIDKAVADERERCARIAEGCHLGGDGLAPGEDCCGSRVAREIRRIGST